jgi:hypothetical protein
MIFGSRGYLIFILLLLLASHSVAQTSPAFPGDNAKEIVRRLLEVDQRTVDLSRNYNYQRREVRKHLERNGEVKVVHVKTWEVTNLYGEPYARLIQRDGRPLSNKEEQKETERLEKTFVKRRDESEEAQQKRRRKGTEGTRTGAGFSPRRHQRIRLSNSGRRCGRWTGRVGDRGDPKQRLPSLSASCQPTLKGHGQGMD